jgi:hypothetical protein
MDNSFSLEYPNIINPPNITKLSTENKPTGSAQQTTNANAIPETKNPSQYKPQYPKWKYTATK